MRIISWSVSTLIFAAPLAAQKINPNYQINWPLSTGSTAPVSACTAANFGQPYTDYIHNLTYVCTASGWTSSGAAGGVTKINGVAGAFTFTGSVTCSSTTCNFTGGGGGGGVNPGVIGQFANYSAISQVSGDQFFSDSAPANPTTGSLIYTGPHGASFTTANGGNYSFSTGNSASVPAFAASQINLTTSLSQLSTPQTNAGNIRIATSDTAGNSSASNVNISASSTGSSNTGAGNVNITASGNYPNNNGLVNIGAAQVNISDGGGGINITGNSGGPDVISITTNSTGGSIHLTADSGSGGVVISSDTISVDNSGNTNIAGSFTAPNLLAASGTGCIYTDAAGLFHTTNAACGGGGGGSIGGSGTVATIPIFVTNTTTLGNSPLSVAAGILNITDPINVNDGSGTGLALIGVQGTPPSPATGSDTFYADSTANRWKMNNNNTVAQFVPGVATAGTSTHCVQFAANGIDLQDGGTCLTTGGTPTRTIDSGAGTGATATIVAGATDMGGWITVVTGTSPVVSSGVITINFSTTYAAIPRCAVKSASPAAAALTGTGALFVPQSTSTTANFVMQVGSTALAASTTYVWEWQCVQ